MRRIDLSVKPERLPWMLDFFQDRLQRRNRYGLGGTVFSVRRVSYRYNIYANIYARSSIASAQNENMYEYFKSQIINKNTQKLPRVAPLEQTRGEKR